MDKTPLPRESWNTRLGLKHSCTSPTKTGHIRKVGAAAACCPHRPSARLVTPHRQRSPEPVAPPGGQESPGWRPWSPQHVCYFLEAPTLVLPHGDYGGLRETDYWESDCDGEVGRGWWEPWHWGHGRLSSMADLQHPDSDPNWQFCSCVEPSQWCRLTR